MTTRRLFQVYLIVATISHIVYNFIVTRDEPYNGGHLILLALVAFGLYAVMVIDEAWEADLKADLEAWSAHRK